MEVQFIGIESGHGSNALGLNDPGAVGKLNGQTITERTYTVALGQRVLAILKSKPELSKAIVQGVGIETKASVNKKTRFINTVIQENLLDKNKCLSLSIHMNASSDPKPSGSEVWYQTSNNQAPNLGLSMVNSLKEYNIITLRPKPLLPTKLNHWGRLYIDDIICPAILVEVGFISNPDDAKTIWDNIDRMAESLAHGLLTFIRNN